MESQEGKILNIRYPLVLINIIMLQTTNKKYPKKEVWILEIGISNKLNVHCIMYTNHKHILFSK